MDNNKYPKLIAGLSKNLNAKSFVLDTMTLNQQQVDEMCAALQTAVGGKIEVREWVGVSKNGKKLPGFKLEAVTAEQLAERRQYGAAQRASRGESTANTDGDNAL